MLQGVGEGDGDGLTVSAGCTSPAAAGPAYAITNPMSTDAIDTPAIQRARFIGPSPPLRVIARKAIPRACWFVRQDASERIFRLDGRFRVPPRVVRWLVGGLLRQ